MKKAFSLLLLCLLARLAPAQIQFTCTIEHLQADFILVEKPFRGLYFPQTPEQVARGKKDRFEILTADNHPGFLTINFGQGRRVRVFLEPGRESSLEVDLEKFEQSLAFSGPQAAQNEFLQGLDRTPMLPLTETFTARGGEEVRPKDAFLSAVDHIEAEKKILAKKDKKRFSTTFVKAMEADIALYHIAQFTGQVSADYELQKTGQPSKFTSKWAEYWTRAYLLTDLKDASLGVSEHYLRTLDHYLGAYRLGYLGENEYEDPDLAIGEQFLEYDRLLWKDFKGDPLEYAVAGLLSLRALQGNNELVLFDLFQKFQNDFPESPYLPLFGGAVAPIGKSLEKEKLSLPAGMVNLADEADFNTVDDLLGRFEGKVVYLDIWASWCSPCLFEFRQSADLEHFAEGKEIALLFISVDNEDRMERWQNIIEENNLKGYHLMANYSLRDELINRFGDGSNLALPRYLIFDKKGKLVDENAKHPSHNSLLLRELQRYLD